MSDETLPSMVSPLDVFSLHYGGPRDCIHFLPQEAYRFQWPNTLFTHSARWTLLPWSRPSDRVFCHTSKPRLIEIFGSRRVESASYADRLVCGNVLPGHVRIGMGRDVAVEAHVVA